jgi:serine/threonine protein kinase
LCDFGIARIYDQQITSIHESLSHQVSTRQYRAPELLFGSRHYSESIDLWSFGVICIELILLRSLFPSHNDLDQMYRVFQLLGTPTEETWPVSFFSSILMYYYCYFYYCLLFLYRV